MKSAVLELRSLTIGYAGRKGQVKAIASDLTATLRSGELVCLLGPNGVGKSTLLRTLTGIREPLEGEVLFEGRSLRSYSPRELARLLSIVLTHRVAVGTMPVETLVSLGRYPYTDWAGRIGERDREAVRQAIAVAGIEALSRRPFIELSDGEQQKTMIARALAQEPRVMILDEPTAFLDLPRRVELTHLLRRLAHDERRAVLMSTHELDLALHTADRLWLLPPGGPLVVGAPEDLVLRGAFSPVFSSDSVHFNLETGAFRAHTAEAGKVSLSGSGMVMRWTSRALERAGYRVTVRGGGLPTVQVDGHPETARWRVEQSHGSVDCESIEAMLDALHGSGAAQ